MTTRASAPVFLSVVDGRTRLSHLVASQTAARHRHTGRYPALCGEQVIAASLTTEPMGACKKCDRQSGTMSR